MSACTRLSSDKATVSDLAFAPSAARAALRTNRSTPGRAFPHPGSIGTTSTLALAAVLGVIGLDDAGHEVVANHVLGAQSYETDALDMAQRLDCVGEARALAARQVDLAGVAGHDHARALAEPGQEHAHLHRRRVLRLVEDD